MIYWAGLLFSTFGLYFASRFIMRMSLADCWCLFWVLIQSSATLWWTGLYKRTYIFMCLLCYYFRGVCESYSCFEEKVWTFVCSFFPAVKKYFFKGWDYSAAFFVVDSKLKPYLYEWILKVNCKFVFCFFSRLNCEDPQRKWMIN